MAKNRLVDLMNIYNIFKHCLHTTFTGLGGSVGCAVQEVAGSTPAEVGNILSWRLIMKYFLRSLPSADSKWAFVSVSGERMCTILVNLLED